MLRDLLCSKIGGIWCYWPTKEAVIGLLVALVAFSILVYFWIRRRDK